jgi:hypothetical protein
VRASCFNEIALGGPDDIARATPIGSARAKAEGREFAKSKELAAVVRDKRMFKEEWERCFVATELMIIKHSWHHARYPLKKVHRNCTENPWNLWLQRPSAISNISSPSYWPSIKRMLPVSEDVLCDTVCFSSQSYTKPPRRSHKIHNLAENYCKVLMYDFSHD